MVIMELRIHSDTHMEGFIGKSAEELSSSFFPLGENEYNQVLILAGDICSVPSKTVLVLYELSKRFKHIIYVPGNHEYYGSSIDEANTRIQNFTSTIPNLSVSAKNDVEQIVIDGVRFIFCTLWTDPFAKGFRAEEIEFYLADFRAISGFSIQEMAKLHQTQKNKLTEMVHEKFEGKTVVISHHMPSFTLCHPRFGFTLNHGFASDCEELLWEGCVDLWCFGHTHDYISQLVGTTPVICNPTGYRGEWNRGFAGGKVVVKEI